MPIITVSNDTHTILNIAFSIGTPVAFENEVEPRQKIRLSITSLPHTIEVREDRENNRFSWEESRKKVEDIGTACAAGLAAVVLGTVWATGALWGPLGGAAYQGAGAAWGAAHAGGARYFQDAEAVVLSVGGVIPLHEKHFSIRTVDEKYVLWDTDDNKALN